MRRSDYILVLAFAAFAACNRAEEHETALARVDDEVLTLERVKSSFDSARAPSEAQVYAYVQRWMVNELLYREAVRRGLEQKPDIDERISEIRRQLVINALLDDEIYTKGSMESTAEEVAAYYEEHKSDFALASDVALISYVLFADREAANLFRSGVVRGTAWNSMKLNLLGDARTATSMLAFLDSSYQTEASMFPRELWRIAMTIARGEPSTPIRTGHGFYVLIVWKTTRRGVPADLGYVSSEIRNRLALQKRQTTMNSLVEGLRAKHTIELHITSPDPDTSTVRNGLK